MNIVRNTMSKEEICYR